MTRARAVSVSSSLHTAVEMCMIDGVDASVASGGDGIRMERWARQGAMRRIGLLMPRE
jgi:hypothetical protein